MFDFSIVTQWIHNLLTSFLPEDVAVFIECLAIGVCILLGYAIIAIIKVPEGSYYAAVEGSRGEFGVFLESRGDKYPYRLKFRSTGLPLVSIMETVCRGAKIADLIAIGGTVDYVVPDIDR